MWAISPWFPRYRTLDYSGSLTAATSSPVTEVKGFRFAGLSAGIKKNGSFDLGAIVADEPVPTAALFTRNLVRSHPVNVAEQRVLSGRAQACLVNSGNSNACTGAPGLEATLSTTAALAEALGISAEHVLPASTGVIGKVLPAEKLLDNIAPLVSSLSPSGADDFAEAIRTTDRWKKVESTTVTVGEKTCTFLAIGKGAGMFHPDLGPAGELPQPSGENFESVDLSGLHATMLVFIVTDADADVDTLKAALFSGSECTFNAATVDGDTSTSDTVILMASGKSGVKLSEQELTDALVRVCAPLAKSMVLDGEGAEHAVTITVSGMNNDAEARDIARVVATSPLVKTAITGKDANWGRLLMAAGKAGVPFDPSRATVKIGGVAVCENGLVTAEENDKQASQVMKNTEYEIEISLGSGLGKFSYLTSDLGHGYVDVNAGYRT